MQSTPTSLVVPESDLALRAPLDPSKDDDDRTVQIRPLLYRIYVASHILRLGSEARFAALVFLHRYTAANPSEIPMENKKWVLAACLFLACKAEEEPRRLRDVINLAHMLLSPTEVEKKGKNTTITLHAEPPHLNQEYWDSKKKIIETEQIVLRWLGFDVSVSHPHRAVVLLLEKEIKATRDQLQSVAFRHLNDALFHGPALQHLVLELACATIELAKKEVGARCLCSSLLNNGWWKRYNISDEALSKTKRDLIKATSVLKEMAEIDQATN